MRDLPEHMLAARREAGEPPARTRASASGEICDVNVLDWFLVLLVLAYAVSGYWQGFITGAFATAGLLLGGLLGIWLAPRLLGDAAPALWVSLAALFVVLLCASLGQAVLQYAGARIREPDHLAAGPRPRRRRRCRAEHGRGAGGRPGRSGSRSAVPGCRGRQRRCATRRCSARSTSVMPPRAVEALNSFNDVVGSSFFPRYLEPFAPERIVNVGPPPAAIARDPDVVRGRAQRLQDPRARTPATAASRAPASSTRPTG